MPIKIKWYQFIAWLSNQAAGLFYSLRFKDAAFWVWSQAYGWGDNVVAWKYFKGDEKAYQSYVDGRAHEEFPEVE